MRKIAVSMMLTLDGFMAGTNSELDWHTPHWSNELMEQSLEQLRNTDHILMGRITYESMVQHWPLTAAKKLITRDDREFAERMNRITKTVFSTTLNRVEWNAQIGGGDLGEELNRLKKQPGKDIIVWGGLRMIASCIDTGHVDEYRMTIIPVFIGDGRSISDHTEKKLSLKLSNTRVFANGVVSLTYKKSTSPSHDDLLKIMTGRAKAVKVKV